MDSMSMLSSNDSMSSVGMGTGLPMNGKPYEAPKFKTFQERKKEKEKALAIAAGREWVDPDQPKRNDGESMQRSESGENSVGFINHNGHLERGSAFNPQPNHNIPYRPSSVSPLPPSRSSSGHRSNLSLGGLVLPGPGVPLAPQNIGSIPQSPSTGNGGSGFKPLPSPGGAGGIARQSSMMSLNESYERSRSPLPEPARQMRHQASQPVLGRFGNYTASAGTLVSSQAGQSSPTTVQGRGLPVIPGMDAAAGRPLPKPMTTRSSTLESVPEPSTFSSPLPIPHSSSSSSSPSSSPFTGLPYTPSVNHFSPTDHGPSWSHQAPSFNRSETVTSVKSLDRFGMTPSGAGADAAGGVTGGRRPLPPPPVGVGSSRSLDRGVGGGGGGGGGRSPSRADERECSASGKVDDVAKEMESLRMNARTPRPIQHLEHIKEVSGGTIVPAPVPVPVLVTPTVAMAAPIAIPILSLPDEEEEETCIGTGNVSAPARVPSPSPGFSVTLVEPMDVKSSDTRDQAIPSINIPIFSFPDDQDDEPASSSSSIPMISLPGDDEPIVSQLQKRVRPTGPGIFCERCDNVIIGRIVTAMDKRWHPECFRCTTCRTLLEHVSSYDHEGQAYCHMDYHDVSHFVSYTTAIS